MELNCRCSMLGVRAKRIDLGTEREHSANVDKVW
jgi:hypothetical protein